MEKLQTVQEEVVQELGANGLSIIVSKGTLDMVYPAFMLASAGAAMGMEVNIFFTFWGMNAITKKGSKSLKIAALGNPALPMPSILGLLPGMTAMATRMMKGKIKKVKVQSIPEMIKTAKDIGVKLHACSTSMELMGVKKEELLPEVDDIVGAAAFLELSRGAQTIFI